MESEEELDYDVDLDVQSEKNEPLCESESNSDGEDSEKKQNVFDRYCIKYLKTSECDCTPCSLSHELIVSNLLTEMKYNNCAYDNSDNPCDFRNELKILQDFLSDASSPPPSLIKEMCQAFAAYNLTGEILGMSKLLTKQYAQSNCEYLHNVFMALLHPLRHIYGSQDTAVAEILDYICKKFIIPGDCEPKILDNIVKTIERSVHIDDKLKVFKSLIALEYYVFPQTLLDSLFHYTVRQSQRWIRANQGTFKWFMYLLLRDSQEEHFFRIWQSSPHFVVRLRCFLRSHHMLYRIFQRKLAKFNKASADDCKTPLLPKGQTSDQRTRVLTVSSTNVHTMMSAMHKCTEEHTSLGGQNTKYVHTLGPQNISAVPLYPGVKTLNQDNKAYSSSYGICAEQYSAGTCSNTLHEDSCTKRFGVQFNKKDAVFSSEENNAVVPLASNDGECCSSTECSLRPCDLSETLSLSQLATADFEQEAFGVEQFLNVSDYQSLLSSLEKWQSSRNVSNLTRHVYNVLTFMDVPRVCNSLHGLLTVATQSGKFSVDLKRCLSTISVNLLFNMISKENWQHAYEIMILIMKHELPYFSCEVYKDVEYSSAKRILAFVEVCMVNKDFEQAISLLVDYNLLAVDNEQWCLQSTKLDRIIRNELVSVLLDKMIKSDLRLTYRFLMYVMEAQKNIEKPVNLVKIYEQLLRKLLEQSDESTALQLFKDMYLCHKVPIVYNRMLCRALIVLCVNNNEMNLARLLVKKGRFLGIYPINKNFFSVTIQSNFTRHEMRMLVEEILNAAEKQQMDLLTSGGEIETDLCFTVVEAADDRHILPNLLVGVNSSVIDAKNRLISVLRLDIFPCLFVNPLQEDSSQVVVHKSVLTKYFSYHLQKARSSNKSKIIELSEEI